MSSLIFNEIQEQFTTPVPDVFIEKEMPSAPGQFVKIYLYMYHAYYRRTTDLSITSCAEAMNIPDAEVTEALRYWNEKNVLAFSYNRESDCYSIRFAPAMKAPVDPVPPVPPMPPQPPMPPVPDTKSRMIAKESDKKVIRVEQRPSYSSEEILLCKTKNPRLCDYFENVEAIMKTPLSGPGQEIILSLVDFYGFNYDTALFLIRYCVEERDTRNFKYIEAIAIDWADNNINTVEQATAYVHRFDRYLPVFYALHINFDFKNPAGHTEDLKLINSWYTQYAMDSEVIVEAAKRTFERTHAGNAKAKWNYLTKVLENWNRSGIHTMEDIRTIDQQYQARGVRKASFGGYLNNIGDYTGNDSAFFDAQTRNGFFEEIKQ